MSGNGEKFTLFIETSSSSCAAKEGLKWEQQASLAIFMLFKWLGRLWKMGREVGNARGTKSTSKNREKTREAQLFTETGDSGLDAWEVLECRKSFLQASVETGW